MANKKITESEKRRIQRWLDKGDRLGLRLHPRATAGSAAFVNLTLEPERVKDAWLRSTHANPWSKVSDLARRVGLEDQSFLNWFELAAPELLEDWVEQAASKGVDDPKCSAAAAAWFSARVKASNPRPQSLSKRLDWAAFEQIFGRDRTPIAVALRATGAKVASTFEALERELEARGYDVSAPRLCKDDPEFCASIREYLRLRRAPGSITESAAAQAQGLHPASLHWRLAQVRMVHVSDVHVVEEILTRWRQGESVGQIAKALDMSTGSVSVRIADFAPRGQEVW